MHKKINRVTADKVKEFRKLTGCGMILCRDTLRLYPDFDQAIDYLRSTGDEPHIKGLSEERADILKDGEVIDTFKTIEEATSIYNHMTYKIRSVNKVGHYSYLR